MSKYRELYKQIRWGGSKFTCNVCGHGVRKFFPFSTNLQSAAKSNGFPYDFRRMETLNFDNCNCPFCLSSDRERLYLLFLDHYISTSEKGNELRILDFAPNPVFAARMKADNRVAYFSADLLRHGVDLKLDICNMSSVADQSYDVIICSHILEHVPSPDQAISECARILSTNGIAIFMVPLFWDAPDTVEDPKFNISNELRLKHYGQDDHVRLFGKSDFLNRLSANGFNVVQLSVNFFDDQLIKRYAIAENSILYICRKNL